MTKLTFMLLAAFLLAGTCLADPLPGLGTAADDLVTNLPGLDKPVNFSTYSGYLEATGGRRFHYWFTESQRDPVNDPLVLWLNGGPGCSSLMGLLTENGPFQISKDANKVLLNPTSWNLKTNVIFMESPAGVGFSYRTGQNTSVATDDDQTSLDNYAALKSFFVKFPQYKKNKFFITGESYGGIYVPTLSVRVLKEMKTTGIKFTGWAVGNGYLDSDKLGNSLMFFGYYHGLYGNDLWDEMTNNCCQNGHVSRYSCEFTNTKSPACMVGVTKAINVIQESGLDIYNVYDDCAPASLTHQQLRIANGGRRKVTRSAVDRALMVKPFAHRMPEVLQQQRLRSNPPCSDAGQVDVWLTKPEVRRALHIPDEVQAWAECSDEVEVTYKNTYPNMKSQVLELIRDIPGLIYNGDVDMACNFLGDEWFVDDLGIRPIADYQPWHHDNIIAGFVKHFTNLTYVTVKGSGHMVPTDKPEQALQLFETFVGVGPHS